MRILLVDDIPDQVRKYQKVITDLGHEVESVDDSRVAYDLLQTETFDALVTDMQMPVFSGLDLIQMMYYLQCEIPTLLHSSEYKSVWNENWVDLTKITEKFTFVTFHQKTSDIDPTSYIKPFLESVEKGEL